MASKPKWVELLDEFAKAQYRQQHADLRYAVRARLVSEIERVMTIDEADRVIDGVECYASIVGEVVEELRRARKKFRPMHGPHEGYAVILEELEELWTEIRMNQHDRGRMRAEAVQVAAMAIRFIGDVCDRSDEKIGGTDDDD